MFRTKCITCDNTQLQEVINLGMHPMADRFIPENRLAQPDTAYPLVVDFCATCHGFQLRTETSEHERYAEYDYSYTSANSYTSRAHWTEYASTVGKYVSLQAGDKVLEIGSNDGFLSEQFAKRYDAIVMGIDAAPAMVWEAAKRDVPTLTGIFGTKMTETLKTGDCKLIVANNVFNHSNTPLDFSEAVATMLAPNGTFVFELPYWRTSVEGAFFDQVYHEHVSYFTVSYASHLFERVGLHVNHVEYVNYHGGSIRVFVSGNPCASASVDDFIVAEEVVGIFRTKTYVNMVAAVNLIRSNFLMKLHNLKQAGYKVVCAGAAAKANTFLNYYKLDSTIVDYVTDASPSKIGKWTPLTRIPIVSDDIVTQLGDKVAVIVTSWNLLRPISAALTKLNPDIHFLNPYAV
jgi:2-polyprenyl-3-methyl-5-hydroxy-6-metoxy-1,4-benzoquinol methylase